MRKAADPKPRKASTSRLATGLKKKDVAAKKPAVRKKSVRDAAAKAAATDHLPETPPAPVAVPPAISGITLAAECIVREAATMQAMLIAAVAPGDEVIIDGSAVTRIDASGLQLLVAFARRELEAGRRIRWQDPSHELCASAARVGLAQVLGLDAAAGAAA